MPAPIPIAATNTPTEQIRLMINETTVLNEAEKKYWLDLLPTMNEGQLAQLKNILETEQKNMREIDKKYDKKLEGVAQKYLSRWDSEKVKAAKLSREQEENKHAETEHAKAAQLLSNW